MTNRRRWVKVAVLGAAALLPVAATVRAEPPRIQPQPLPTPTITVKPVMPLLTAKPLTTSSPTSSPTTSAPASSASAKPTASATASASAKPPSGPDPNVAQREGSAGVYRLFVRTPEITMTGASSGPYAPFRAPDTARDPDLTPTTSGGKVSLALPALTFTGTAAPSSPLTPSAMLVDASAAGADFTIDVPLDLRNLPADVQFIAVACSMSVVELGTMGGAFAQGLMIGNGSTTLVPLRGGYQGTVRFGFAAEPFRAGTDARSMRCETSFWLRRASGGGSDVVGGEGLASRVTRDTTRPQHLTHQSNLVR